MSEKIKEKTADRLYIVGVGPGDPELITLKACKILSRVPVIFVPQRDESTPSYARSIIDGLCKGSEQKIISLIFPMVRDKAKLVEHWEKAAETIRESLSQGQDCAFVNEGDPYLFGTAIHVLETLRETHPEIEITVVPGVSSINASAAQAGFPLAVNEEKIAILSGHCEDRVIRQTLENFDTVVFLKVNSVFGHLLDILEEAGLAEKCIYISRCTTEEERIVRNIRELKGEKLDYLSLLIMKKQNGG
ncbi:MAG: precorrin-2 C(20)-methyltransferase [Dehalococcoidales bacterium]|nr:precorrin-2 C(20)-methyltransferase [Dehalococcoidales bacterium]MDZ4230210.1 precorrin-2 C(20)-methyltransferase [Dehalococcoidales bacterium]